MPASQCLLILSQLTQLSQGPHGGRWQCRISTRLPPSPSEMLGRPWRWRSTWPWLDINSAMSGQWVVSSDILEMLHLILVKSDREKIPVWSELWNNRRWKMRISFVQFGCRKEVGGLTGMRGQKRDCGMFVRWEAGARGPPFHTQLPRTVPFEWQKREVVFFKHF